MFVHVPSRRKAHAPWSTLLLLVTTLGLFLLSNLSDDAGQRAAINQWGTIPATLLDNPAIDFSSLEITELVKLVTALFVHRDWLHLAGNILFLLIFGFSAERLLGSWRILSMYLICGAFANLVTAYVLIGSSSPIIGASGAVSAMVGAYLALFPRARLGLVIPLGLFFEFVRVPASALIGFWLALQLAFTFWVPGFGAIAWVAHLAGFGAGVLFALLSRNAVAKRLRG